MDETHWETYQKQVVYLEVRNLLSFEDLFSSKISKAEDWVRYLTVENKNCRIIEEDFEKGYAALQLTGRELPKTHLPIFFGSIRVTNQCTQSRVDNNSREASFESSSIMT
jgi:hypothetical protein